MDSADRRGPLPLFYIILSDAVLTPLVLCPLVQFLMIRIISVTFSSRVSSQMGSVAGLYPPNLDIRESADHRKYRGQNKPQSR